MPRTSHWSRTREKSCSQCQEDQRPYHWLQREGRNLSNPSTSASAQTFSFQFLGLHISQDLTWTINCPGLLKKAHQLLFFLRLRRKGHLTALVQEVQTRSHCWRWWKPPNPLLVHHFLLLDTFTGSAVPGEQCPLLMALIIPQTVCCCSLLPSARIFGPEPPGSGAGFSSFKDQRCPGTSQYCP